MSTNTAPNAQPSQTIITPKLARKTLDLSAKFWFIVTLIGQVIFSYYIVAVYYVSTFNQDTERFNKVMPGGYVEGDLFGNIAVIIHVLFAAIITFGGIVQLIPYLRNKFPALHRWNGRLYIFTAIFISLTGAYMILTRHDKIVGDFFGHLTVTINGLIIIVCAIKAIQLARQKKFALHRIWALRLFVAASGVWFFRVGLMVWLSYHGKPVGFDPKTFSGPFLMALQTTVYILPLLILEFYIRAHTKGSPKQKVITAAGVVTLSLIMAFGIFAATFGMWLPRI